MNPSRGGRWTIPNSIPSAIARSRRTCFSCTSCSRFIRRWRRWFENRSVLRRETDRLPRARPTLLKPVELLMVPCEWNRPIFREGFRGPIEVVPHSVERPDTRRVSARLYEDRVRFILKATDRHVSLRVPFTAWYPLQTRWLIARLMKHHRQPPALTVITDELSNQGIEELHRQGGCYVSLCRSEGWGMGAFDAAASGRPVIMTGYGWQTEFLPEDLAHLVKYRLVSRFGR